MEDDSQNTKRTRWIESESMVLSSKKAKTDAEFRREELQLKFEEVNQLKEEICYYRW